MRRSIALCWKGLRSYCTDAGDGFQSSKLKIFDRHLKRVQRDRAAWLMKPKDSLVDTVAENLLDRLEDCERTFPTTLCMRGSLEAIRWLLRRRGEKKVLEAHF
ncbi:PREDICTED: putative methyltransferase At1g22800 [Nicotiana attenuata]|uniref:putative methyltransferase At1g22800 n=1 Tax=Nicotiana attenuata TaxID=49451 RepID=UPI0009057322|nr:PREDICTED: putative methyltransferase At1g22800 [Nicotiana attenuata]